MSSKTRQSNSRASNVLRIAAQTLARSRTRLGNFYRRLRARLGAPQAITATAHKLARIVYHLLTTGQAYDESVFVRENKNKRNAMKSTCANKPSRLDSSSFPSPRECPVHREKTFFS